MVVVSDRGRQSAVAVALHAVGSTAVASPPHQKNLPARARARANPGFCSHVSSELNA
jgi:hypothetical protein